MTKEKKLTTSHGTPVNNDQSSITTGKKTGYGAIGDGYLIEKLGHFTRERIPERVVHAKGSGAYGYFEVTADLTKYTCAKFLNEVGKRTDIFIRFSTVGGEQGSADTVRDPRGFAVKFYTEEGNYDMVGNNIPIFFIRDAMKFPDFVHTQKRNPQTGLKDPTMFWDFLSLTPESIHQTTFLFTNRCTPDGYRHMHGFSSHTFMFYNEKGEHTWFKWHFKTDQGIMNFTSAEAAEMAGTNPEHDRNDLQSAIEKGDFPSWTVNVQLMSPEQAKTYRIDPFDVTKVWPHGDFPLIPVGKIVLNRNPTNFFAEVEQAAFAPTNFVQGIFMSPDKLLQGRMFAYEDAQRYRLGVNNSMIPVNKPKHADVYTNERDGHMMTGDNSGSTANYFPNSVNGHTENNDFIPPPAMALEEAVLDRHRLEITDDDFTQTGIFYRKVLNDYEKSQLISNLAEHMCGALKRIQYRQAALFYKADPDYGTRVANALHLDVDKVKHLSKMSQEERILATAEET